MSNTLEPRDRFALEGIVQQLEAAWNAGDGVAFATPFSEDADFVNIRADHLRGREAIAAGHAGIFRSIYAGSTNRYALETARLITPEIALVHVRAELDVPAGPMAGKHAALFSMVLKRRGGGWQIVSFHNTLAPPQEDVLLNAKSA